MVPQASGRLGVCWANALSTEYSPFSAQARGVAHNSASASTESTPRSDSTRAIGLYNRDGCCSVDVTADTLYEAAILGMNTLNVRRWARQSEFEDPGARAAPGDGARGMD